VDLAIKTGHSWTSAVLESVANAGIPRLILAHINPLAGEYDPVGLAQATANLPRNTPSQIVVASDSLVIDLSSL
jgi:hypothetical protein